MELFKKILTILSIILFPIGLLYCVLHTIGKSFVTFIGSIVLIFAGIVICAYLIPTETITNAINGAIQWVTQLF